MEFKVSASRDLQKIARNPGKMIRVRTHQKNSPALLGITTAFAATAAITAFATRLVMKYRRNPQAIMRPVITTLNKSEKVLDKAATGLKSTVENADISPELKREIEKGIDEATEHLHQASTAIKKQARQLESVGTSNGRPSGRPFGTTAHDA